MSLDIMIILGATSLLQIVLSLILCRCVIKVYIPLAKLRRHLEKRSK